MLKIGGRCLPHEHRHSLSFLESSHTRQYLAFQELERCATTSGDVGHLLREASLLHGSNGIAATDDRATSLACELRKCLSDSKGALAESIKLENTLCETNGDVKERGD